MSVVDLWFKVQGTKVPSLHGYALYAGLCAAQPVFHGAEWLGVHTLHGERDGDRLIRLPAGSRLGLRLPLERIGDAMAIAGRTLSVAGHHLLVGLPEVRPLTSATSLSARMVTIKGFQEEGPFTEAVKRQLADLDLVGIVEVGPRLVQRVGDRLVVGFAMRVHGLSEPASLRLQELGLGGRRRFGCGLFRLSRVGPPELA
jgi:CRISPR-associated protein Cas6